MFLVTCKFHLPHCYYEHDNDINGLFQKKPILFNRISRKSMTSKIMVTLLLCWVSQSLIMALHLPLPLEPPPGNSSP